MLLLNVDRTDRLPIWQQIVIKVKRLIDNGTLKTSDRLPPSRVLARRLGVNRSTAYRAYQELWAGGYLESRPGSYSTVRAPLPLAAHSEPAAAPLIDWQRLSTRPARETHRAYALARAAKDTARSKRGVIDFSSLTADRSLSPVRDFQRVLRQVLGERGGEILEYGTPAGHEPLRAAIAQRLQLHGLSVTAAEVMITNGSQHGLDLAFRMLVRPGARVIVESPTYALALPLLRLHGAEVVGIPMTAKGLDLERLARALDTGPAALVYTMPSFHNPTGITTSQQHRERLLALCERHRVPLLEDGFEEEMKYFGKAVLPVKSMDRHGIVIYFGTFSKVAFPGLRVGWITAPRDCIERLTAITRFTQLSTNHLAQVALARFCELGHYERHVRRVHATYRKRMHLLHRALHEHLPAAAVSWSVPMGGYTSWLEVLRSRPCEEELHRLMADAGVLLSPGSTYFPKAPRRACFRLSIANHTEADIVEGVRRMGRVLRRALGE